MLCFHGTSADNLESILQNGLQPNADKVWNCSLDEIYCWPVSSFEDEYEAMEMAKSSATIALATSKDCRAVVIAFEIDESELDEDYSCENMDDARVVCRTIKPEEFTQVYVSDDLSLIKGVLIGYCLNRDYYDSSVFSEIEIAIGELFNKSMQIHEYMFEMLENMTPQLETVCP